MTRCCPACSSLNTIELYDMGDQPVSLVDLQSDPGKSATMPQFPITLRICPICTHVYNSSFNPECLTYSREGCHMYNSGADWAEHVNNIVVLLKSFNFEHIIEVGAGDCSFLRNFKTPSATLLAIDPCEAVVQPAVPYLRELFSPIKHLAHAEGSTLIIMRHLLEHLAKPADLIRDLADRAWERDEPTWCYIEVPCCENALELSRIEDWTYEHPQHFTEHSLSVLLEEHDVANYITQHKYNGEVICCLIRFDSELVTGGLDVSTITEKFKKVGDQIEREGRAMRSRLGELAFWGGAGKSAMFIRQLGLPDDTIVVDSDQTKWGLCVPGTGIKILSPDVLKLLDSPPKIIATTSWRADDIKAEILRDSIPCDGLFKFQNGKLVEVPLGN